MNSLEESIKTVALHGLVEMTNDQYHEAPGVSKSHLDCIATASQLHYWAKYIDPQRDVVPPTPDQLFGSAMHIAILEPDLLYQNVICGLEIARRSNVDKAEWAAFEAEHADKIIIPSEKYASIVAIRDAVHRHPIAHGILTGGEAEQSFFVKDSETGQLMKCRTDYLHHGGGMVVDVKTCLDASPVGFGKSAGNYRYDVQTAWYYGVFDELYGEHPDTWAFMAVEKEHPYAIGIYFPTPDQIARAAITARRDFMRIVECRRAKHFPDYGFEPQELILPGWIRR